MESESKTASKMRQTVLKQDSIERGGIIGDSNEAIEIVKAVFSGTGYLPLELDRYLSTVFRDLQKYRKDIDKKLEEVGE